MGRKRGMRWRKADFSIELLTELGSHHGVLTYLRGILLCCLSARFAVSVGSSTCTHKTRGTRSTRNICNKRNCAFRRLCVTVQVSMLRRDSRTYGTHPTSSLMGLQLTNPQQHRRALLWPWKRRHEADGFSRQGPIDRELGELRERPTTLPRCRSRHLFGGWASQNTLQAGHTPHE